MSYNPAYHNSGPFSRPDLGSSYLNYYDSRGSGGGHFAMRGLPQPHPPAKKRTTDLTKAEAEAMEAACGSAACFGK
jgi:hypothetical protein